MRDTRKPVSYFTAYLQYEQRRIAHRLEKLSDCGDAEKRERISANLLLNRMNVLVASFSYGVSRDELSVLLRSACATAVEVRSLTYGDALTLVSLSVMLEDRISILPLFERFHPLFDEDRLLSGLRAYIESGTAVWTGNYRFPTPYKGLDAVISALDEESGTSALLEYLEGWYAQCSDCAWYETANSNSDVYFGYWSFESAAVAKVLGLNGRALSQNPYFPVI